MGIFNFTDNKTISPQATIPSKINLPANVLASLNLTAQDIDAYHNGIIEKEATEAGVNYYKEHATNITQAPPIKLGEIALSPKVQDKSDLVPSMYAQLESMEAAMESTLALNSLISIKSHFIAFALGYAQAAQDASDWQTALKSFDKTTQGGITQKPEVIKKYGDLYKDDLETRVKIAELIQELVNSAQPISSTIQQTTPPAPPVQNIDQTSVSATTTTPSPIAALLSQVITEPAPPPPAPNPQPTPTPAPTPIVNLKPQNPNETPLTPVINLAQPKPDAPITTTDGIILRPVPQQNPATLTS